LKLFLLPVSMKQRLMKLHLNHLHNWNGLKSYVLPFHHWSRFVFQVQLSGLITYVSAQPSWTWLHLNPILD
jgi:hypothetical protein